MQIFTFISIYRILLNTLINVFSLAPYIKCLFTPSPEKYFFYRKTHTAHYCGTYRHDPDSKVKHYTYLVCTYVCVDDTCTIFFLYAANINKVIKKKPIPTYNTAINSLSIWIYIIISTFLIRKKKFVNIYIRIILGSA